MSMRPASLVLVLITLAGCAPVARGPLSSRQRAALARHDWLEAVQLGRERVRVSEDDAGARYDLACALARAGDDSAALRTLSEAIALGYDDAAWLSQDEDLQALRGRPEFNQLVVEARRMAREGPAVPGTRVVLREELPAPLRLRLPTEDPGRGLRLALWLHPSGATLNASLERLAPVLLRHGFALAVPIAPRLAGWNGPELRALLDQSVPRLRDLLDVEHPLLLGFSAGAEAALAAWAATPERFAAVWAAAPAAEAFQPSGAHPSIPMPEPARASPLVLLFGADDAVLPAWQALLPRWRDRGVKFSTEVIPGRGHELLFDEALLERALQSVPLDPP